MLDKINKAIVNLRKAEEKVLTAVKLEMVKIATKEGITQMDFTFGCSLLDKDGEEVTNKDIDKLYDLYLDEVNDRGFNLLWTKENGWK